MGVADAIFGAEADGKKRVQTTMRIRLRVNGER
jgi:hypothetical protein